MFEVAGLNASSMTGIRVVQVHSKDHGGGAEATARLHHQELRRRGIDARLLVGRKKGDEEGIELIPARRGPPGLKRASLAMERMTGRQYLYSPSFRALLPTLVGNADVVHFHSLHGAEGYADIGTLAEFSRQVPVVMSVHDFWLLTGHCAYPLACDRWLRGCGACPDLVRYPSVPRDGTRANFNRKRRVFANAKVHLIAPSRWLAGEIAASPVLGHLPVTVVHAPIDTSVFFPSDRAAARARLGLPMERSIVLMAAQNIANPYKGIIAGLAALDGVSNPGATLVVVGRQAEQALARCRMRGIAAGYQADTAVLADYYRAADVLLMPSKCETFGMVAAEAMACGTPVVAFAAGGLPDVLGNDEGGLLVAMDDIGAMTAAVEHLLGDRDARLELGSKAAHRAAFEFGVGRHSDRCLDAYLAAIVADGVVARTESHAA